MEKADVKRNPVILFCLSFRCKAYCVQRRLLERIAESLGIGESEVLRQAFMEYA